MPHGSTPPHTREPARARRWRAAWRRGAILGGVATLHLFTLALVLRPAPPYRSARSARHGDGGALQLDFVARLGKPRATNPLPRPPHLRATPPARRAAAAPPDAAAAPHPVVAGLPAPRPDGPGDYHTTLAGADSTPWAPHVRMPGSDAPPHSAIMLRTAPSLRQVVRAMTTASRCKYERMKMERSANQFVTRQLVERALDADGCGPQTAHADDDNDAIEAISRGAIRAD